MKTQAIDNFTPEKSKEGKHTHTIITTNNNKITGINNHWPLISLNTSGLNSPIKRHRLTEWIQKQDPFFFCIQETPLNIKDRHDLRVKG